MVLALHINRRQNRMIPQLLPYILGSPSSSVSCTVAGAPTTPQDTAEPLDNTQNTVSSSTCWIYRLGSCVCLQNWQMLYELELSSQCSEQPDLVDEEVNATTGAVLNTNLANRRECNTWYCSPHSCTGTVYLLLAGTTTPSTPGSGTTPTARTPASPTSAPSSPSAPPPAAPRRTRSDT